MAIRRIEVREKVMAKNDEIAADVRRRLDASGVPCFNLVSSPGSGKTALLERTLQQLGDELSIAVVTGDVQTENDAERLAVHTDRLVQAVVTNGACHMDANLQDDREPMPSIDDPRRQMVDRYGYNECALCHKSGKGASPIKVHNKHVGKQWQWCYNCHEGDDGRPLGSVPPVTQPKQSCSLCHGEKTYKDAFPFDIHRKHADVAKCYACHQAQPPLFDWPSSWMKN